MATSPTRGGGGRRRALGILAAAAAVSGIVALAVFVYRQQAPPEPSSSGSIHQPADRADDGTGNRTGRGAETGHGRHPQPQDPMTASRPTSISIPAIDVESQVIAVGKNPDGTLEVPRGEDIDKAAWYQNSPTPGQPGPSVIEGHIDTVDGPSVFYRLADLEPGDVVDVARADGSRVEFTVTAIRDYPTDDEFPTRVVYGGDLSKPSLRLITCSNFDPGTGHYAGNTVVYTRLSQVDRGR